MHYKVLAIIERKVSFPKDETCERTLKVINNNHILFQEGDPTI